MDKKQFTGKVWVRRASNVFRGRTMASRVPDSSPDWRGSQSSLQHFYPSKCFSSKWDVSQCSLPDFMPPNGPNGPDTSSTNVSPPNVTHGTNGTPPIGSLQFLGLPMVWRPNETHPTQLTSDTGLIVSEAWHLSCGCPPQRWPGATSTERGVFAFLPRAMRGKPLPINDDQLNLICPHLALSSADWSFDSKNWVRFLQTVCNDIFLLR